MIFDSHAHYDDEDFDEDREQVLKEVYESGVAYIVNAGASMESSRKAVELADKYAFLYAAVGVHPQDADTFSSSASDRLKELASHKKVVAIGEIGLDYYYEGPDRELQKEVFEEQVKLALELNLPIIVHDRDAHRDTFDIIKKYSKNGLRGVLHCYSGDVELAREYIKMGFYLGFTGVITFKNARKSVDVLKSIPLDRVLIETDCPYLAPVPYRGKRNDSRYLKEVAQKACDELGLEYDYFTAMTMENGRRLFGI